VAGEWRKRAEQINKAVIFPLTQRTQLSSVGLRLSQPVTILLG